VPVEDFRRVIDVNLNALFVLSQLVGRQMIEQGSGSIINIASILGLRVRAQVASYAASKAAVVQLTKALALEWAEHGIRVNAIAPGYFETDMSAKMRSDPAAVERIVNRVPLRRWGRPRDLAGVAVFLASPAAAYVNGQQIVVDGGMGIAL